MEFTKALIKGKLIKRYKRFFADIKLDKGIVIAHCPNTGSMLGLLREGSKVWLTKSNNPNRKLKPYKNIDINVIKSYLKTCPLSDTIFFVNTEKKIEQIGSSHPLQRFGKPQDIASLACFLTSEDASWITGQVIAVDGGKSNLL